MLRIAIAVCVAAQQAAKLVNENGDLNVNLGSASNKFCISGGGDKGCLLAGDVVGKAYVEEYVEEVKTEFLEKTAAQLDERIQVLETDLNDKVDSISEKIAELCKWGFEYMDSTGECRAVTDCEVGTTYEIERPTEGANRRCAQVKQCSKNEFEVVAPGYNQNRVCQKVSTCREGNEFLVAAATTTADVDCAPVSYCGHDEFEESAPSATEDRVCKKITECDLKKQFIRKVATHTSDTQCGPLYTATTAKDGGTRGRAGDSCEAVFKVRDGKVKGCLFQDQGVWIRVSNKPVTVVCKGNNEAGFKTLFAGQSLATKTSATCEELFAGLKDVEGSAFAGKKAGDSALYYSAKGIKTCQLGADGNGSLMAPGGKLKDGLDSNKFAGLKPSDFVFWIDSIHAQPESGTTAVDFVNGVEFEWYNRGRTYKLKQDKSVYHNNWWFEGYGYFRKSNADLKSVGLPKDRQDRTLFAWARPSREAGWINHLAHYGTTSCGRAFGLGYTHYYGKDWVGNHKWCGGYGFRGAEWQRRQNRFVGTQIHSGGKMRSFSVAVTNGNPRVVWGTQTKNNEHNTYIDANANDNCRGYFRIGSRICDWEWFYGGMSSVGMTKMAMNDAQIVAVYKASIEWREKRD